MSDEPDEPAGPPAGPEAPLTDEQKAEQLRRYLENLDPEDFGKFQM